MKGFGDENYWMERAQQSEAECQRMREALGNILRSLDEHATASFGLVEDEAREALATPPPEGEPNLDEHPTDMSSMTRREYLESQGKTIDAPNTPQQAHGDALAALVDEIAPPIAPFNNEAEEEEYHCESAVRHYSERVREKLRRHLTASGEPCVPRIVRELPDRWDSYALTMENGDKGRGLVLAAYELKTALASAPAVPELSHKTAMQLVEVFDNYEDERGPGTLGRRAESMQAAWRFVHRAAAPTDGRG